MAVSTTTLAVSYDGNESTVTPYPIPFPFLDVAHIFVATHGITWNDFGLSNGLSAGVWHFTSLDVLPVLEVGNFVRDAGGNIATVTEIVSSTDSDVYFRVASGSSFAPAGLAYITYGIESDEAILPAGEYTVTRLADGSGGSLVTAAAKLSTFTVTIFRQVPLTQPTVFQLAGPFPAKSNETAFDRLLMICQQLNRRLNELEGEEEADYIFVPQGSPEEVRGTRSWANSPARGAVVPKWAGQLGVQLDDLSIWKASSTSVGAWVLHRDTWQKEWRVFGPAETVTTGTYYLGTLSKETFVKNVFLATTDEVDGDIEVSIMAGDVEVSALTIDSGAQIVAGPGLIPTTGIPVGVALMITVTAAGYTPRLGLDVILECSSQ